MNQSPDKEITPNLNTSEKKKSNRLTLVKSEMYSGPLPHPDMLAKYEQIQKGMANRIIKMAENQSNHRQSIEKSVVASNIRNEKVGMGLAFFINILIIIGGIYLINSDKDINGFVLLASGLGIQFYNYYNQQKKKINKT